MSADFHPVVTVTCDILMVSYHQYIRTVIPQQLYDTLLDFLTNASSFVTSLSALLLPIITTHPSEWDPQIILPPLITLLSAYLALISIYRTTTWMIRTSIFFIKWGAILAVIVACAGWVVGNTNSILLPFMGDTAYGAGSRFLFDLFNTDRSKP
jgi:hypothetical protein